MEPRARAQVLGLAPAGAFFAVALRAAVPRSSTTFLAPGLPRQVAAPSAVGRAVPQADAVGAVPLRVAVPLGAACGCAAAFLRARRTARRARPTPEEWISRVRTIEGQRAVFDVTIPKPLGLVPANFPNRPGVGVARINDGGNTDQLNRRVLIDDEEGMWVLEGDEVVAVDGNNVEGKDLAQVAPLVKDSAGDSVTLTLCRAYMAGPVKVLFVPSGKVATMKRGIEISSAARVGVEEVSYSCKEGWCKSCWHTDAFWGTQFRACAAYSKKRPPPDIPRTIPMQWNNVMPLVLLNFKETQRVARERRKAREAKKAEA